LAGKGERRLSPAATGVRGAVASDWFALLVSRKDTVPVGEALPFPETVAVNE
jgi:hypothetical protein